jgi:hypothetical protein
MISKLKRLFVILTAAALVLISVWVYFMYFDHYRYDDLKYGVTFDPENAGSLGLDPRDVYQKILYDWNFKYIRIPLHWDKVEKNKGEFNFDEMDYYMAEAAKTGAKITLAIGNKTPRWPECHSPSWSSGYSRADYLSAVKNYIARSVEHYRDNISLEIWQVENEPFLPFGNCLILAPEELHSEIALVKDLDPKHPILVSDSGELSTWVTTGNAGDYFGTTLYRVVWNRYLGYWNYDWVPPVFYRTKFELIGRSPATSFVVELQAEPWSPNRPLAETSSEEQRKSMDLGRLEKNIEYTHHLGVSRVYLWGSEWWAWLIKEGKMEIPNHIKSLNH